ncbi:MAG TPA: amidohydrolase family protein, partial [Polyangiaceae bacterium]|nr:amidohydrolase family protein [Polyangiaceae bacterium]
MTSTRYFVSRRALLPGGIRPAALEVERGRIARVLEPAAVPAGATLEDFGDLVLMPGIVDTHVHINEPGRTEWEGFETATRAAARGGITTVVDMPLNSIPPATSPAGVATKAERTEGRCFVDVGL